MISFSVVYKLASLHVAHTSFNIALRLDLTIALFYRCPLLMQDGIIINHVAVIRTLFCVSDSWRVCECSIFYGFLITYSYVALVPSVELQRHARYANTFYRTSFTPSPHEDADWSLLECHA